MPGSNDGLKRPFSSKTDATSTVSSPVDVVRAHDPIRPEPSGYLDPLDLRFLDLVLVRRHLGPVLERDHADPPGTEPFRRARDIEGGSRGLADPREIAQRRPRRVQRDVAAADHDHVVAEVDLVPEVRVQQKVDRVQHAVELDAGDLQLARTGRTDPEEHGREPVLAQRREAEVATERLPGAELDAHIQDRLDLVVDEVAAKAVRGDPEHHHAARSFLGFEYDRLEPVRREVVRARESSGPRTDDRDPLAPLRRARDRGGVCARRAGFHAVLLADEPLEGADRDRFVDRPATARHLAWRRAHSAADRRERVRQPRDVVREGVVAGGDGGDVPAGVREDGTCACARNVVVEPRAVDRPGGEGDAHVSAPCSRTKTMQPTTNATAVYASIARSRQRGTRWSER